MFGRRDSTTHPFDLRQIIADQQVQALDVSVCDALRKGGESLFEATAQPHRRTTNLIMHINQTDGAAAKHVRLLALGHATSLEEQFSVRGRRR